MNENKENKKEIKTTYKDKDGNKYEIEVKEGETKTFKPKDKDGPEITVAGVEKSFFKNKFKVGDKEESTLTGWAYASIGVPLGLAVLLGVYFLFFRKKKNKREEEAL